MNEMEKISELSSTFPGMVGTLEILNLNQHTISFNKKMKMKN